MILKGKFYLFLARGLPWLSIPAIKCADSDSGNLTFWSHTIDRLDLIGLWKI